MRTNDPSDSPKRRRNNSQNKPTDHFISAYAHHLEEAVVHLHAAYLIKSVPKAERLHLKKMKKNLAILHRREQDRQSSDTN